MEEKDLSIHITTGTIIKTILIGILFVFLFLLRDLLLVVLASIVIASAIEPITRWFVHFRIKRIIAVLFIYLGLVVFLFAVFYFIVIPLLNETSVFLASFPEYVSSAQLWSPLGENTFFGSQPFVKDISNTVSVTDIAGRLNNVLSNISQGLFSTISIVFGGILSFILMVILSFYLAVQENGISSFLRTMTPIKHRDYVTDLWARADKKIGLWMQGQVLLLVIVALLTYLGLTLLGVKHALLLAALAGIFEVIPFFGPILSGIPAVILAFIGGGYTDALMVVGLYVIIQQFESQLIYPLVVKKVVGVPSIVVILALIAGGTLAGFLGIILAVPIAAVLMELFQDLQKGKFVHTATK